MRNINKKAFTLVELIIVITILAILGSIAFVSFQSYSADARDTKRKSNLKDIVKTIEVKSSQGISFTNFVSTTGTSSQFTSGVNLAGTGLLTSDYGTTYKAGDVNLVILGLSEEFKDGGISGTPYKIGATSKIGGVYQVSGRLEGNTLAYVDGNYIPRTGTGQGAGFFKVGDTLTGGLLISAISQDLQTLTLSDGSKTGVTAPGAKLAIDEIKGLIKGTGSTNPVVNGGIILPY